MLLSHYYKCSFHTTHYTLSFTVNLINRNRNIIKISLLKLVNWIFYNNNLLILNH
ncbi:hypothetical protein Mgra_00008094 [Meloidogyne graminicola]|uniref:Uncharacterized protein n=1 Tax=Meloidogyne graminicola TaxID=189291 RepID=A0A8S9ZGT4_9BILA|nr:hypothetical protein Mgra_00008094 [Meloidogyne graminicola]